METVGARLSSCWTSVPSQMKGTQQAPWVRTTWLGSLLRFISCVSSACSQAFSPCWWAAVPSLVVLPAFGPRPSTQRLPVE